MLAGDDDDEEEDGDFGGSSGDACEPHAVGARKNSEVDVRKGASDSFCCFPLFLSLPPLPPRLSLSPPPRERQIPACSQR